MATEVLRPDDTVDQSGTVLDGAATRHAALSDDDDASSVLLDDKGDYFVVSFPNPSVPFASIVKRFGFRVRCSQGGGTAHAHIRSSFDGRSLAITPQAMQASIDATWVNPTTISVVQDQDLDDIGDANFPQFQITLTKSDNNLRVYELYLNFVTVAQPELTVDQPSGTINNTSFPTVRWTPDLDEDGEGQALYEVKVFDEATFSGGGFDPDTSEPVDESGRVESADQLYDVVTTLDDGTYRAYVRIAQMVNGELLGYWSEWAFSEFEIDVLRPAAPLSMEITPQPTAGRLRFRVTVDQTGDASADKVEIQRNTGDGWERIRAVRADGFVGLGDDDIARAWDMELGNGIEADYRVRALHVYGAGDAAGPWITGAGIWQSSDQWLKAPTRPDLNLVVRFAAQPSRERAARQGIHQPLGATVAVVVSDTRGAIAGPLSLNVYSDAERALIDALLDLGEPLLVQGTPSDQWQDRYLSFGDLSRERAADKGWVTETVDSLSWVEVDPPAGGIVDWPSDPPSFDPADNLLIV